MVSVSKNVSFLLGMIVLIALTCVVWQTPVSARPACDNVGALEQWHDDRVDHATDLLDSRRHVSEAFDLLSDSADVMYKCAFEIIDAHTRAGVEAGNTDEDGLRKTWIGTTYGMIAADYDKAAEAAAVLHKVDDCKSMIYEESAAFSKFMTLNQSGFNAPQELKKCSGGGANWATNSH